MRAWLPRCLLVLTLFVQGLGSAWASVPSSLPEPARTAATAPAEMPCHGHEAATAAAPADPAPAMPCCDGGDCDCALACVAHGAPLPAAPELGVYLRMHFDSLRSLQPALPAHPHALLRPPSPTRG